MIKETIMSSAQRFRILGSLPAAICALLTSTSVENYDVTIYRQWARLVTFSGIGWAYSGELYTGFSDYLPTGRGLFAFRDADGVIAAIDAINDDYEGNREAARAIAEEHFDSDRVLTTLVEAL